MKINSKSTIFAFIALALLYGCSHPSSKIVYKMSPQPNGTLKISGPEAAILGEIQRGSIPGIWQSLIPVYRLPADTNLKDLQKPQPGTYRLLNSEVVFTPDTPFAKGQIYYLRFYHYGEGKSISEMIRNKTTLGSQPFTDLTFKY